MVRIEHLVVPLAAGCMHWYRASRALRIEQPRHSSVKFKELSEVLTSFSSMLVQVRGVTMRLMYGPGVLLSLA
jgi:hypothetical protein